MTLSKSLLSSLLLLLLLPLPLFLTVSHAAIFEIRNQLPFTVWAAAVPGGGQQLNSGQFWIINVNAGTTGRIWARTGCNFDVNGRGRCRTGDCGGLLQCHEYGSPPNSLAEYALNGFAYLDFYDVSLVHGFNVPLDFGPTTVGCRGIRCSGDINGQCPNELRAPGGCNNPCTIFRTPQYCCTNENENENCGPTAFSRFFKARCPDAYSYPQDDATSTFTCRGGSNFRVVFGSPTDTNSSTPPTPRLAGDPNDTNSSTQTLAPQRNEGNTNSLRTILFISIPVVIILVVVFMILICSFKKKTTKKADVREEEEISRVESLLLDFNTIATATNNFSEANKLGQGGFGSVYKGILFDGQEIAVKRLSIGSAQGLEELRNEVVFLANLQHRNLVRLLGCCLEEQEKLLVYEYIPNTSLDKFLFDPIKRFTLDWPIRYKIIGGIARGLLYLHEESQLTIIHRDLKASNILLGGDMSPKIADFGLARLFGGDQSEDNTSRIAGTFGYMAPEYVGHGHFSRKSDVYSFGVLVLEIVTGRKSSSRQHSMDLVSKAWQHWTEGTPMELLDQTVREPYSQKEVLRCIHMGLLCVHEDAAERPPMSSVVLMLNSFSITAPAPSAPAFFGRTQRGESDPLARILDQTSSGASDQLRSGEKAVSHNDASITDLYPR